MLAPAVRLAQQKSEAQAERDSLATALRAAEALDELDRTFASRIAEHRRQRGSQPEKLSKNTKNALRHFAADEEQLNIQLLRDFAELSSSHILQALRFALEQDIANAKSLLKYCPPLDLPVSENLLQAKVALLAEFTTHLQRFPSPNAG